MLKKKRKKEITTVIFPSYDYTATIDNIDIVATNEGVSIMRIEYAMQHPELKDGFVFIETITNDIDNLRTKAFFSFLKESGMDCADGTSWMGLVFKVDIAHECYNEAIFPVLVNRRFVSHPLIEKNKTNLSNKEN